MHKSKFLTDNRVSIEMIRVGLAVSQSSTETALVAMISRITDHHSVEKLVTAIGLVLCAAIAISHPASNADDAMPTKMGLLVRRKNLRNAREIGFVRLAKMTTLHGELNANGVMLEKTELKVHQLVVDVEDSEVVEVEIE